MREMSVCVCVCDMRGNGCVHMCVYQDKVDGCVYTKDKGRVGVGG